MTISIVILASLIPLYQGLSLMFKIIELSEEEQERI